MPAARRRGAPRRRGGACTPPATRSPPSEHLRASPLHMVREGGVEPPRAFGPLDPKSSASASFATLAGLPLDRHSATSPTKPESACRPATTRVDHTTPSPDPLRAAEARAIAVSAPAAEGVAIAVWAPRLKAPPTRYGHRRSTSPMLGP